MRMMSNVQDKEEINIESGQETPGPLEKHEAFAASETDESNSLRLRQTI